MAVKILSVPGLLMQKITTAVPDESQLEVAIVAVKACLMERPPEERIYDVDSAGNPVNRESTKRDAAPKPENVQPAKARKEKKEKDRKEKKRKTRERKPGGRKSDTMELEIPVAAAKDSGMNNPAEAADRYSEPLSASYGEIPPAGDGPDAPVDDLYTRIIEGTAPVPEEVAASQVQGLWSGEPYVARQQYLYDLNEIMKTMSEKAGR